MLDIDLKGIHEFLQSAERLKDTLRNSYTSKGRHESTAEHTWRVCLMALVFGNELKGVDMLRLFKMLIIHDLGEAINGDVAAIDQTDADKNVNERKDLQQLISTLPRVVQHEILDLWDDYDRAASREAILAKSFDKLETIIQHNQGDNPPDFNYGFNLSYGKKFTESDPLTRRLRAIVDADTERLAKKNGSLS